MEPSAEELPDVHNLVVQACGKVDMRWGRLCVSLLLYYTIPWWPDNLTAALRHWLPRMILAAHLQNVSRLG